MCHALLHPHLCVEPAVQEKICSCFIFGEWKRKMKSESKSTQKPKIGGGGNFDFCCYYFFFVFCLKMKVAQNCMNCPEIMIRREGVGKQPDGWTSQSDITSGALRWQGLFLCHVHLYAIQTQRVYIHEFLNDCDWQEHSHWTCIAAATALLLFVIVTSSTTVCMTSIQPPMQNFSNFQKVLLLL